MLIRKVKSNTLALIVNVKNRCITNMWFSWNDAINDLHDAINDLHTVKCELERELKEIALHIHSDTTPAEGVREYIKKAQYTDKIKTSEISSLIKETVDLAKEIDRYKEENIALQNRLEEVEIPILKTITFTYS